MASAVAESYAGATGALTPYRGYYFRILSRQGQSGPGGAKSYIANGKMSGGFAFVAFPAQYRSSGVMTFIVGSDGIIYERSRQRNRRRCQTNEDLRSGCHLALG